MANLNAVKEGTGRWFPKGTDHGRPVRVKVHALEDSEEQEARKAAYGNRKAGQLQKETIVRSVGRGEAYTREAAIRALEDSENFNVALGSERARELFGKFPRAKDAKGNELPNEVCFDGQWTPEVKRAFFSEFAFSKSEAKDIADKSASVGKRDAEEEEEATEDFSQP